MYRSNLAKRILSAVVAATMMVSLVYSSSTIETRQMEERKALAKQQEEDLTEAIETVAGTDSESSEGSSEKEETVYVMTDGDGNTEKIIVSDRLKNEDKKATIEDKSDLTDIENVKGEEEYTEGSDGSLSWQADGAEICYQGKSDKELPVDVAISYELNGKAVTADELAGQSGRVTIRFDYTNKEKTTVEINGKSEEIFVPFTMVSGMVLDPDKFSNIEVTNGKVISEGDNSIVVGYAFPGLTDSLGIGDELLEEHADEVDIPDYVEVTADVENFELGMTMTVAMNDLLSEIDLGSIDTSEIDDSIQELDSAASKLLDGTISLEDGSNQLAKAMDSAKTGAEQLSGGVTAIVDGISTTLPNALTNTIGQYKKAANGVDAASGRLTSEVNGLVTSAVEAGAGTAANEAATAAATAGIKTAMEKTSEAYNAQIKSSLGSLSQGVASLSEASKASESYIQKAQEALQAGNTEAAGQYLAAASQYASGVTGGVGKISSSLSDLNLSGDESSVNQIAGAAAQAAQKAAENIDQKKISEAANKAASQKMDSVKSAATTLANSAGAKGAVTALEGVKSQVAKSFSTDDLKKLKSGAQELADGTGKLQDGASQLADGAKALKDGMNQFDRDGIQKLISLYNDDVSGLLDRFEALQDAGKSYQTYTKLADGTKGSVKFIYKSGDVSADKED